MILQSIVLSAGVYVLAAVISMLVALMITGLFAMLRLLSKKSS